MAERPDKNGLPDELPKRSKPPGYFASCEIASQSTLWLLVAIAMAACFLLLFKAMPTAAKTSSVIIYTSQDEVYAEPIFRDFEKQTGIVVKAVFDSEAVKTVGLVNRLLAEKSHPQCDVFWNNEEFRTRELAARGIFRQTNGWTAVGYRTRRLVVNTNLLPLARAPRTFTDATNAMWRGKAALAYPLFGTTASHFLALRQQWGDPAWRSWCRALAANKPFLVDGNSVVVNLVGAGEAWFGFTDSDDIAAGQREGKPVAALPVSDETLFIPMTIGVLWGAPHPAAAQKLFEYLQSAEVARRLVREQALESVSLHDPQGQGLRVKWDELIQDVEPATAELKEIFLR